jgi:predicted transcriptional regulator
MTDNAVETIEVDGALADRLREEAALSGTSVTALVDELLRHALSSHEPRAEPEPGYDEFLRRKVERARASAAEGRLITHEDVEAHFSERRLELQRLMKSDRA